jgi:translation elongation factor EF-Tu-like GTPase
MNNLFLKSSVVFIMLVIVNNIHSQNMGELVGSNIRLINQNYKILGNNEEVVEGLSYSDLKRQQNYNIKNQENSRKELLKSHVLKQTKPTRKRMKQTLKKSQRLLAGKPLEPAWQVWVNRKKAFSQRKENKNQD